MSNIISSELSPWSQLRQRLQEVGCFEPSGARAVAALVVNLAASLSCFGAAALLPWPFALLLFPIGTLFFYRIGFLMHDGAHGNAFGSSRGNEAFAIVCCALLGEFLSGWRYGHNRHHAFPNVRGRDNDQSERWDDRYQYRGAAGVVVAVADIFFLHRFGRFVRVPKTLFLVGVRDGVYAFRTNRRHFARELTWVLGSQVAQIAFFVACFGPVGFALFVLHSHIGIVYLNAVFAGNHYDMPSFDVDGAASLANWELQVRATRNYTGGVGTHFVCGGLDKQIEHHLFPTLPRHRLGRAAPIVRAWCAELGLPYPERSLSSSLVRAVRFHLR
jgi:fatty acid desaturase